MTLINLPSPMREGKSISFLALMIFFTVYFLAVAMSLPIASLLTLSGGAIFGWWAV